MSCGWLSAWRGWGVVFRVVVRSRTAQVWHWCTQGSNPAVLLLGWLVSSFLPENPCFRFFCCVVLYRHVSCCVVLCRAVPCCVVQQTTIPVSMPRIIADYVDSPFARSVPNNNTAAAGHSHHAHHHHGNMPAAAAGRAGAGSSSSSRLSGPEGASKVAAVVGVSVEGGYGVFALHPAVYACAPLVCTSLPHCHDFASSVVLPPLAAAAAAYHARPAGTPALQSVDPHPACSPQLEQQGRQRPNCGRARLQPEQHTNSSRCPRR